MPGWISIHRKIQDHWVYEDAEKLKAWICILLTVNHEPKEILLGNKMVLCDRGQSFLSIEGWAKKFGKSWNRSKVRRYMKCLESASMIVLKPTNKTTILTVCNYDTYQTSRPSNDHQMTIKRPSNDHQTTTNNNINNINNENNENNTSARSHKNDSKQEKVVLRDFPLAAKNKTWDLTEKIHNDLQDAFPHVDIVAESKKAKAWLIANSSKRKTERGMPRFLFSWIERASNSNRAALKKYNGSSMPTWDIKPEELPKDHPGYIEPLPEPKQHPTLEDDEFNFE